MEDLAFDHGLVEDGQGRIDIPNSAFFDLDLKFDDSVEYREQILYQLMIAIEGHLLAGHWQIRGGHTSCLEEAFTLACIKIGRAELAERAVTLAEKRLSNDKWPEYYDTRTGRFIGKQARLYQTWTIAGYLTSKMLLDNPNMAAILTCDEDLELLELCICGRRKSSRTKCSRLAARSQVLV